MSSLRVTSLKGSITGTPPDFPDGVTVTGVATASGGFSGDIVSTAATITTLNLTNQTVSNELTVAKVSCGGSVTADSGLYGDGSGLTGIATIGTAGYLQSLAVSGNVDVTGNISVGGTLTYEDVTNVDSVGMVTARQGIKVLAGGINAVGVITASSYEGRHSQVPKNAQTSSYTLVKTDAGKCVSTNSGVTVPDAVFAAGDCVTIWNDSSSAITITQGTGFQLRKAGETSTGNVSLKNFGLATLWWNTGGTAVISGNLA